MKRTILVLLTVALSTIGMANAWASTTVTVSGNTVDESAGENGSQGWWFNRDTRNATPFQFTADEASLGRGSLYVAPIGPNPSDKLVAENFVWQPIDELTSISYDYLIAGTGTTADADDFYLNVYANVDATNNYYDCRFDYTPADPANLDDFATAKFEATDTPTRVAQRGTTRITACPATLAEMPEGSHVRAFAINVGQSTASDLGLAGYLDNVVVTTADGATAYDFEPTADACKDNGYLPAFASQGACVSTLKASPNAGK